MPTRISTSSYITSAKSNSSPNHTSQANDESISPLATPTEVALLGQDLNQANCPSSETEILTRVQTTLMAFQETNDRQLVTDLQDSIACWLNTGGDVTALERSLNEALTEIEGVSSFTQFDLTGDGQEDIIALIPAMSMTLLTFIEHNGFTGDPLYHPTWLNHCQLGCAAQLKNNWPRPTYNRLS